MRDWKSVQLKDAGTWLSGGTPFTDNPRYWDGDIPWISAASLKDFRISRSDRRITKLGAVSGTRLVPPGTVLFVVRGMSLKTEFRVGVTERQVAFGQDCKAIMPVSGVDAKFLALALKARSRDILAMVDEAGHGTGRLPTDLIAKLRIDVPAPPEQRRITEILDSADDQIRRTEQIVVKLRVQKSGLLQQLIGEESTQNSPYRVGDALLGIDAGWSPLCDEEPPSIDRWGVLKVSAVTSGRYVPDESKTLLAGLAPRPEIEVKNDDVIMCRANGAKELVGAVVMIRDTPPKLMLSDKTLRLIANTAVVNPAYLCHFMGSWPARKQIGELLSGSSGQNNISQKFIRSMRIPIPDLPRQQQIVEALTVAEDRIEAEGSSLEGLRRLRQGLTDDLLMGRIRVSA